MLLGIPYLHQLRTDAQLRDASLVWPFETGFSARPGGELRPLILHAEIWPGLVEEAVAKNTGSDIRDKVQMEEMCRWAARADKADELGSYFAKPDQLDSDQESACLREEGWILGTPSP